MKWKDIFRDPDHVCESEYRAIHDCVASAIKETDEPDPESEVSLDDRASILAILDMFRDWTDALMANVGMKKCAKVVISVRGGVAELMYRPGNVLVEIRDYDTEGCNPDDLDDDGAMVGVYGGGRTGSEK